MDIFRIGHSCFKLKGKAVTLVTDPFDSTAVGIKFPKLEAEMVTVSHQHPDHNAVLSVGGTPLIISGPGEYEVKGVRVSGLAHFHDDSNGTQRGKNTVYRILMDGISLVHLGDLGHEFTDADLDVLDRVDVLFVPVGGIYTLTPSQAIQLIAKIEPKIVIPMHYKTPGINEKTFGQLSEVSIFLKEIGKEGILPVPKLNITKDKLPEEQTIVLFE